jgi:heme/copper-type cytochrome/quinol oxidase subunit 4
MRLLSPTSSWLIMIAATIVSFAVAERTAMAQVAATVAILIGAFKARLIFLNFMELEWRPLRLVYEAWVVVAIVVILGSYWRTLLTTG